MTCRRFRAATAVVVVFGALLVCGGVAGAAPPVIVSQSVTAVTPTDATLNADINPNGLLTKYKLELDTTGRFRFRQTSSCPLYPPGVVCAYVFFSGDPLASGLVQPPEFTLPASAEDQHVSLDLASIGATLQPGTTYHFRAVAANNYAFVYGSDLTFTTPAEGEMPPVVENVPGDLGPGERQSGLASDPPGLPSPSGPPQSQAAGAVPPHAIKQTLRCGVKHAKHRRTGRKRSHRRCATAPSPPRASRR